MSSVVYMVPMGFLAVSQYLTKHLKVMGFLMAGVVRRANVYHLPVQHRAVHFAQVVSALAEGVSPNGTKDNLQCNMYCHVQLFTLQTSSTQVHPAKIGHVLVYSPCLFGKRLFSMQDKLVKNKHFLQRNFSETITPIELYVVV